MEKNDSNLVGILRNKKFLLFEQVGEEEKYFLESTREYNFLYNHSQIFEHKIAQFFIYEKRSGGIIKKVSEKPFRLYVIETWGLKENRFFNPNSR